MKVDDVEVEGHKEDGMFGLCRKRVLQCSAVQDKRLFLGWDPGKLPALGATRQQRDGKKLGDLEPKLCCGRTVRQVKLGINGVAGKLAAVVQCKR